MRQAWIVVGETGKGPGRQRWIAEAHDDESSAQDRVRELVELLSEMSGLDGHWSYVARRAREEMVRSHGAGDRACVIDRTGAVYSIETCPLYLTRSRQLGERLAVLALAIALNVAILWATWKWQPGKGVVEWLLK